jgi:hypothetical protein
VPQNHSPSTFRNFSNIVTLRQCAECRFNSGCC